jgi:HK97 gp10 family phage protein
MTIRAEGLKETIKSLEKAGVEVQDLKAASKKAGNVVADESKSLAPVKSGKLRNSIRASNTKNKSVVRAGGARLPYAAPIHYGWPGHNIEPHPFLTDALSIKHDEVITVYEEELEALIRRLNLN